jgi:hypothetical protein
MAREAIVSLGLFFLTNISIVCANNEILLKSRHFVPAEGISDELKAKIKTIGANAHILVQLEYIPTMAQRKELEDKGIKLLSYIPDKAWFASITSDKVDDIVAFPGVRAICEILPEDKIDHSIKEDGVNDYSTNEKGEGKLVVLFFGDVSLEEASTIILAHKGTIVGAAPNINALVIYLPKELICELAGHNSVKWIDQHYEGFDLSDGSRAAINVNPVQEAPYYLDGTGVIVGQWETLHPDNTHDDLEGRITNIEDGYSIGNHATRVAGTLLGDGSRSEAEGGMPFQWRGMATNATIVSYHSWYDVNDLYLNYNEAINTYGIDLSTNSWGTFDYDGQYDENTQAYDDVVIGACGTRISIIQSAGNMGAQGWKYLRSIAVAKNIISVGATNSENDSLTTFSSRGPAQDGRIKPDLMAPGCEAESVEYDWKQQERYGNPDECIWSDISTDTYSGDCGTSYAAPAVSGSVALMLEDWRDTHTGDPLPSTIKAVLIQTARDLGNTVPDYSHGYGIINVKEAVDLIDSDTTGNDVILEDWIVEQNDKDSFAVEVPEEQSELKITLVWDDYPGEPAADKALVNDLDLIVKDPSGTRYYPWTLDPCNPANPAVRNQPDSRNNVEQVSVENPIEGIWIIEIKGTDLPESQQPYSLTTNNLALKECLIGGNAHANEHADWVAWGRPNCWCYQYQCRGDINGKKNFGFRVQLLDLQALVAAYNKNDTVLAGIPNGICADINHKKNFGFRVQLLDLQELVKYYNKSDAQVPSCDAAPLTTGPYNYWTLP